MRIVTAAEMAELDARAIKEYGIPPAALMEKAGFEVADEVARVLGNEPVAGARVYILCGKGNNGGDGLVAARVLANRGARVRVFLIDPPKELQGEPAVFLKSVEAMGVRVERVYDADARKLGYTLKAASVIVDAVLGTGARGALRPPVRSCVEAVNEAGRPVVAVDIPTGVDADTGKVSGTAVKATATVTFGLPKLGHLLEPGRTYSGALRVAELGFPAPLLKAAGEGRVWVREAEALSLLKVRPPSGHKGTFGRVVVVAGSAGMAGAAALSLKGALRAGAGLALWAGPPDLLPIIQTLVPEATALPLPGPRDHLGPEGARAVLAALRSGDALALGPGLGRSDGVAEAVSLLLKEAKAPCVVDADALNALAGLGAQAAGTFAPDVPRVITPHVKEASRLIGWPTDRVLGSPVEAVEALADTWKSTALLKGRPTLVKEPGGTLALVDAGDVSLATGGTGDVLTGVVAGLLAQGYSAVQAAALGAYVHGRAGEAAGAAHSLHSVVASDVAQALGTAFGHLERLQAEVGARG